VAERVVVTRSPEETRALGREVGATLKAGDVLLLEGELGAGKTQFVKGLAEGCGVQGAVTSPTYALMHRHAGARVDLVHLDLYRETEGVALEDLDLADERDAAIVVEWPRHLTEYLWPDAPRVRLEHVDETTRRITLP